MPPQGSRALPLELAQQPERKPDDGQQADQAVQPLAAARQYNEALAKLASLREPVDAFFEAVLVNADDAEVRANRYALLAQLRGLFLGVADISLLG